MGLAHRAYLSSDATAVFLHGGVGRAAAHVIVVVGEDLVSAFGYHDLKVAQSKGTALQKVNIHVLRPGEAVRTLGLLICAECDGTESMK